MKKKKAKLHEDMVLRIRELIASIRVRERWLKIVFRDRHTLSTPEQRRRAVAYLREKRYELEVFGKQIPAPPRTYKHYSTCRICKSTHVEAYISSNRYCPSCGEIIMPQRVAHESSLRRSGAPQLYVGTHANQKTALSDERRLWSLFHGIVLSPSAKAQTWCQKSACGALHDCCVAGGE